MVTCLLGAGFSSPAVSAEDMPVSAPTENRDRMSYPPLFFEQYSPLTAEDMIRQLPGFSLEGESEDRGFGQGQGNLLINDKRPSTKSNTPRELLARIPAAKVVRIELLREGSSELSGQSGLIANVVTGSDGGVDGSFMIGGYAHEEGMVRPEGRVSLGAQSGNFSYNVDLSLDVWKHVETGFEHARNAARKITEIRSEDRRVHEWTPKQNLDLGWDGDNGDIANLSFQVFYSANNFSEVSDRSPTPENQAGELNRTIHTMSGEDEYTYEIGGDYATDFADGTLKFIGLRRREDSRKFTHYDDTAADDSFFRFNSTSRPIESETILRAFYTTTPARGHILEWAIEGAYNTLDTTAHFEENTGAGFAPVQLDGSNTQVQERRAESSLLYVRPVSDLLQIQASAAVEYSELSVSGEAGQKRSYVRPKGFVAAIYDLDPRTQLRARIDRKVGQLDFSDFASSRDILAGQTDSGNTELVPEQLWRFELSAEHRFSVKNISTVTVYYEKYQDYNMLVPLAGGGQGIGNVDNATSKGVDITSTWSLGSLGLMGGKIDFVGHFRDSAIRDPFTGITRHFDWQEQWQVEVKFRQDIPGSNWTWGFDYWDNRERPGYRRDRITQVPFDPEYNIHVAHKDVYGMTLTVRFYNFLGRTMKFEREFYDPDRLGDFAGSEQRSLERGGYLNIQLGGKF